MEKAKQLGQRTLDMLGFGTGYRPIAIAGAVGYGVGTAIQALHFAHVFSGRTYTGLSVLFPVLGFGPYAVCSALALYRLFFGGNAPEAELSRQFKIGSFQVRKVHLMVLQATAITLNVSRLDIVICILAGLSAMLYNNNQAK